MKTKYFAKGKIQNYHEGFGLGNGNIGALIYGDEKLTFSLDRVDLWDFRQPKEFFLNEFTYKNMVNLMKNNWEEANNIFDKCYGYPYPTKINAGFIIFDEAITSKSTFCLDYVNGCFSFNNSKNKYFSYIDFNKNVLLIDVPVDVTYHLSFPEYLFKSEEDRGLGYETPTIYEKDNIKYSKIKTKSGFNYGIIILDIIKSNKRTLYVTIYKDSEFDDSLSLLFKYERSRKRNQLAHSVDYKKELNQSKINIPDEKLMNLHLKSKYFFLANSNGNYPMSLQGIWTRSDGNLPPWKADYHNDINLEMSYESYLKTNNLRSGKIIIDFLKRNKKQFKTFAKEFIGVDGYMIPGVMDQKCRPLGGWQAYALDPMNGVWLCKIINDYYEYTLDIDYLKTFAYPFIKGIEKCINHLLIKNEKGFLEMSYSSSPEYFEGEKEAIFKTQTNFHKSLLKFLYSVLIKYENILGKSTTRYKKNLSLIDDYSKDDKGLLKVSDDVDFSYSHRHFSHMLMYKNLELIKPYEPNNIKNDIEHLISKDTSMWVGFSFVEASGLYSYIYDGENAYKYLSIFEDGFVNQNGFHMNMDFNNKGYSLIHSYAFTLEANMGYLSSLYDTLLQSVDDRIVIFPAIKEEFKSKGISFKNIRAKNNILVSASFKNNKLSFSIRTNALKTIYLKANFENDFSLIIDGKEEHYHTKKDEYIKISFKKEVRKR